jgi:hypothetical protein
MKRCRYPKLNNNTKIVNADLRALVKAAIDHKQARGLVEEIGFQYTKAKSCRGEAWGDDVRLIAVYVPRDFCGHGGCRDQLAQVIEHEIDHAAFNLDHNKMEHKGNWWMLDVNWADSIELRTSYRHGER